MKYRCHYETFIDVEAATKEEAEKKALDEIILDIKSDYPGISVWEVKED